MTRHPTPFSSEEIRAFADELYRLTTHDADCLRLVDHRLVVEEADLAQGRSTARVRLEIDIERDC